MPNDKAVVYAISVLAFWLFLPAFLLLFNVGGYQEVLANTNILNVYLNLLIFNIPDTNWIILRIGNFIQIISVLILYLLVR